MYAETAEEPPEVDMSAEAGMPAGQVGAEAVEVQLEVGVRVAKAARAATVGARTRLRAAR